MFGRLFLPREVHVILKVDPALLNFLTRLLVNQDDQAAATKLAADVRSQTAALSGALEPNPPST